jgi:hypothetical protein
MSCRPRFLLAASEGAVVICRAQQDVKPFDTVAAELIRRVRDLQDSR